MVSGIFEMPITDQSYPFSSAERYCHLSTKDYVEREYRVDGTCIAPPTKTAAWRS